MRRLAVGLLVIFAALAPTVASAHPLGNFTVNHYARLEPSATQVRVVYVLDMAEIPTFQEKPRIEADASGYAAAKAEVIRSNLHLTVRGRAVDLRLEPGTLSLAQPAGAGGLPTLRLDAVYVGDIEGSMSGSTEVTFRDDNEPTRIGWREIVARPALDGARAGAARIERSSVPTQDVTNELRAYPEDLLSSPLDVREARLSFVVAASGAGDAQAPGAPAAGRAIGDSSALPRVGGGVLDRARGAFAELASGSELTPTFVVFAIAVSIVLGAAHALQPGHGKTIVAAYLVGSRGTPRHALFLGATVTATHTAGVYALGVVTLFLSQYIVPERLYPILEVASGALVVAIGVWLFGRRLLATLGNRGGHSHSHDGHAHHHHDDHAHDDYDAERHTDRHAERLTDAERHAERHTGGERHTDHHAERHTDVERHAERHTGGERHTDRHADRHTDAERHTERHGGHAHLPPSGERVSWKSLLMLGVSGGLLPCPEALMVLLITIAAHRVLFGLLLIVSFSTGLAAVLVGFGLLLVYARGLFGRINLSSGRVPRLLPVASALVIVVAGSAITLQALPQVL